MTKKWVYLFTEFGQALKDVGNVWDEARGLLGGKGANLADMARINVPVPPGFTVTTEACRAYIESGNVFPEGMWEQMKESMGVIESQAGKRFGGKENPLLVSCRSGAKFSMPGMMDTVLNVGLNDETAESMANLTGDPRFVYDSYRRLIQMYGTVVRGLPDELFENVIHRVKLKANVQNDTDLSEAHLREITHEFKALFLRNVGHEFPSDPYQQLSWATEAVFKSWNSKRAMDYRNATGIPHDLGTAVSIVAMVFGNMGNDCATGVAMTRDGSTGERHMEGDYLTNAQGEDVVAGIRQTCDIGLLKKEMPKAYAELAGIAKRLEEHYRDMQDIEFTIEKQKLWMLQTRDGKRTARATVRIAVDMAEEGLISREEAVLRVSPEHVDFFLHPQFDNSAIVLARNQGRLLARGLNVSPGAACGMVVFDANRAEAWAKEGKSVIMARPETKPDDVHGMLASKGIMTSRGGRTSHAALVARQFGRPAVVGISSLEIDVDKRQMTVNNKVIIEGEWLSLDGNTGEIFEGNIETLIPDIKDPWLIKLLSWADEFRRLEIWANADYPHDAKLARSYGAQGIGLCRSEHMFFEAERLVHVQKMIMSNYPMERREALEAVQVFQRDDFIKLFRVMQGLPVVIRLIDPPLHEFLPNRIDLLRDLADLKIRLQHAGNLKEIDGLISMVKEKETILERVERLYEQNPMLGLRGIRLGILIPEIISMQVRAIFEAVCQVKKEGMDVYLKIMIPLVSHANELKIMKSRIEDEASKIVQDHAIQFDYQFGTMIELPRAALTADKIAEYVSFVSFGTNDLTQTTYGISRDDAETGFLIEYIDKGILPDNPFAILDKDGVGELIRIAVEKGRSRRDDLECGICGEHGGEPKSIHLCNALKLNYVSCSPYRVPVARIAAAHASIQERKANRKGPDSY
ncbi:MAG: pyruvate, phosphate dikinase [Proteobacteria bacterium]|nr:pyruvate, phosphate dikinase [Pseudomonadota bacterium]